MRPYAVAFTVPFCHGWQRAGVSYKSGHHYTKAETMRDEQAIAAAYERKSAEHYGKVIKAPAYVPVRVDVDAYLPAPKRWPAAVPVWLKPFLPFVRKPDADNIAKLMDGLNCVAWVDDAQVTELHVIKHPRTNVWQAYTEWRVSWEVPDAQAC